MLANIVQLGAGGGYLSVIAPLIRARRQTSPLSRISFTCPPRRSIPACSPGANAGGEPESARLNWKGAAGPLNFCGDRQLTVPSPRTRALADFRGLVRWDCGGLACSMVAAGRIWLRHPRPVRGDGYEPVPVDGKNSSFGGTFSTVGSCRNVAATPPVVAVPNRRAASGSK